jgi:hypothetical protein
VRTDMDFSFGLSVGSPAALLSAAGD